MGKLFSGLTWTRLAEAGAAVFGALIVLGLLYATLFMRQLNADAMLRDVARYGRHHELGCLALNTYRERAKARDNAGVPDSDEALMATAWTVKTRLAIGFRQAGNPVPRTLCDVVWERAQYSWTLGSNSEKFTIVPKNYGEFRRAFAAAQAVLAETPAALAVRRQIGPADHYFNPGKVDPRWATRMTFTARVGFHEFYVAHERFGAARRALERRYAKR